MRKSYSRDFENGPVAFGWVAMTWPPCWVAMLQIRWGAAMQSLVPNARDRASDPKNKRGAHLIGRSEGRRHKRQLTGPQEPAAAPAVGEDGVTLPVAANLAWPALVMSPLCLTQFPSQPREHIMITPPNHE